MPQAQQTRVLDSPITKIEDLQIEHSRLKRCTDHLRRLTGQLKVVAGDTKNGLNARSDSRS